MDIKETTVVIQALVLSTSTATSVRSTRGALRTDRAAASCRARGRHAAGRKRCVL